MKLKVYQIINILGLLIMIVAYYMANSLPIGGRHTFEIFDLYPTLFTPARFTFSICWLIYLLLFLFIIYQSKGLFSNSNLKRNRFLYRIDIWFFISSIASVAWIIAWHHNLIWVTVVLVGVVLAALSTIYFYLGVGRESISRAEYYMVHVPFSIYLGWVAVLAITNVAIFLVSTHWYGFNLSDQFWGTLMVALTGTLGVYVVLFRKDFYYGFTIIWALIGIISRKLADHNESSESIIIAAGAGILIILLLSIFFCLKKIWKNRTNPIKTIN
ncbi:MAG TPA: hypothetical protein PK345_07935 [Bacteroidales bacterium]|jgi:hypothetical protein|nr:hypothetical protein [Bacteroidales bacterium]MBP7873818.1 hypothetical protein [Bacteroidales bacterium]MCZ2283363.1 hypothetical protein [Bacteroidales bacterium]NLH32881.1 hypothetical protein [Lentimicrobium sp.]HPX34982.1 hypothetical protein [Bacteroidales bacterium]